MRHTEVVACVGLALCSGEFIHFKLFCFFCFGFLGWKWRPCEAICVIMTRGISVIKKATKN